MIRINSSADAQRVRDPAIRLLLERRLRQLRDDDKRGAEGNAEILIVEPSDTVSALERDTGCCIARGFFNSARFGNPKYVPSFEVLEEHRRCYEIVFIFSDDGSGVLIFVPKQPDIDRELLSLCTTYATKLPKRRRS